MPLRKCNGRKGDRAMIDFIQRWLLASLDMLNGASFWLVASFLLAGILHNIISPERFQSHLGNRRVGSLMKATLSGMLLPMCSCGVIPLGIGLYYSGAWLGPTLAFMTATPIINPAAVLLAYGLLGPYIATIYLAAGFILPMLIGCLGNWLGGAEIAAPGIDDSTEMIPLEDSRANSLWEQMKDGLYWAITDLGVTVSKYVILGMLLAGFIAVAVPQGMIQDYLGNPGLISIIGITLLGAIMYVCAVGHIPFIAALVAAGAAPGVAITFLISGVATNLPEIISIYRMIGPRTVAIYTGTLVLASIGLGYLTNALMPDFVPFFDLSRGQGAIGAANSIIFEMPAWGQAACTAVILLLFSVTLVRWLQPILLRGQTEL